MANDPKYVKLRSEVTLGGHGVLVDLDSGWSVAGLDVAEFPPDAWPEAQRFVRNHLRSNNLEEANSAEFKKVQEIHDDSHGVVEHPQGGASTPSHWQENAVQQHARQAHQELLRVRGGDVPVEPDVVESESDKESGKSKEKTSAS